MAENLKPRSSVVTDGPDRAPSRAMFKAVGFSDEDLSRPIIGVANTWIEIGPCNFHLRRLAAKVKEGVRAAGGTRRKGPGLHRVSVARAFGGRRE